MHPLILHGKPVSESIKSNLKIKIQKLFNLGIVPKLAAILVGDDPASQIYINSKHSTFLKMKCDSEIHALKENSTIEEILFLIKKLNQDVKVHGILVQFPLPKHLNANKIINSINPSKDVDGLHPNNFGRILQGNPRFIPCTPLGCIEILKYYKIKVESKHVVIVGRSNLVGKPLSALLSQKFKIGNATVTICHTKTKNLSKYTLSADILIAAVGKPNIINNSMVKKNSVIIDVGINRINDDSKKGYHIVGDVDFENVKDIVYAITPVPGGVGPMTITMLLYNTISSAKSI